MSVCPSAWKNSAPNGRIFNKFNIGLFFDSQRPPFTGILKETGREEDQKIAGEDQ